MVHWLGNSEIAIKREIFFFSRFWIEWSVKLHSLVKTTISINFVVSALKGTTVELFCLSTDSTWNTIFHRASTQSRPSIFFLLFWKVTSHFDRSFSYMKKLYVNKTASANCFLACRVTKIKPKRNATHIPSISTHWWHTLSFSIFRVSFIFLSKYLEFFFHKNNHFSLAIICCHVNFYWDVRWAIIDGILFGRMFTSSNINNGGSFTLNVFFFMMCLPSHYRFFLSNLKKGLFVIYVRKFWCCKI